MIHAGEKTRKGDNLTFQQKTRQLAGFFICFVCF